MKKFSALFIFVSLSLNQLASAQASMPIVTVNFADNNTQWFLDVETKIRKILSKKDRVSFAVAPMKEKKILLDSLKGINYESILFLDTRFHEDDYGSAIPKNKKMVVLTLSDDEEECNKIVKKHPHLYLVCLIPDVNKINNMISKSLDQSGQKKDTVYVFSSETITSTKVLNYIKRSIEPESKIKSIASSDWQQWEKGVKEANQNGAYAWLLQPVNVKCPFHCKSTVKEKGKWISDHIEIPYVGWGTYSKDFPRLLNVDFDTSIVAELIASVILTESKKLNIFKTANLSVDKRTIGKFREFITKLTKETNLVELTI